MNKQLLLLVFMLMPLAMRAYKVKIGDIYYELNQGKKQAEVTSAGSREWYNGNIVIPASVEYMGVTYSVTTIGNSAFSDCSNMISIVIPNSITSIGNSVFSGCFSMTSVNIPNSVKTIGDSAFRGCQSLNTVVIPNSVETIGSSAFRDCSCLTYVSLSSSVTTIESSTFQGCSSLTHVENIPQSVTTIGSSAFRDCVSLHNIPFSNVTKVENYAFYGCSKISALVFTNITSIGVGAYANCSGIENIFFLFGCQPTIDTGAFENIGSSNIFVPSLNIWFGFKFNDKNSNPMCNGGRLYLREDPANNVFFEGVLNIDETISKIPSYAFSGYRYLSQVIISNPHVIINKNAFLGCDSLKDVVSLNYNDYFSTFPSNTKLWVFPSLQEYYNKGNKLFDINSTQSTMSLEMADIFNQCSIKYDTNSCSADSNNYVKLTSLAPQKEYTLNVVGEAFGKEIVFDYKYKTKYLDLRLEKVNATNTTMTIKGYNIGDAELINERIEIYDDSDGTYELYDGNDIIFRGLKPSCRYDFRYYVDSNDGQSFSTKNGFYTLSIDVNYESTIGVTTCTATGTPKPIDAVVSTYGFNVGKDSIKLCLRRTENGLDPGYQYWWNFLMGTETKSQNIAFSSSYLSFVTKGLTMETQKAELVSDKKAIISAKTNCDDDSLRCGFEWRRYDAPVEMPSNIVTCPVYDGAISGSLNGLSSTTYYKYRPFYQADSGRKYYGNWVAFITADAYVYFDPVVHTYEAINVSENTANVKGYVLAGSDEIIEQGFEYWSSVGEHIKQQASGTLMKTTLNNLEAQTDYFFRSFAKTKQKTLYGEEQMFHTLGNVNGIRENVYVKEDDSIYDLLGRKVNNVLKGKLYILKGKKFIAH